MNLTLLVLVSITASCVYGFLRYVLSPLFFSPLSRIPNAHPTSPLSSLWILNIRRQDIENVTLLALHRRLGSVVRLGPNELSVNCVDNGIRTIYAGGYEKDGWYVGIFDNYGVPNMFATAHSKPHSQRKRLITNVYSKSFVQSSRSLHAISKEILFKRLLPMFQDLTSTSTPTSIPISAATPLKVDTSNTKDVLPLNYAIAMDFMNAYLFGISRSSNFIHDVSARNEFLRWYHCRKMYTFWAQELPNLTSWLRCLLGVKLVPDFVDEANKRIEQFCWEMCVKAHEGVGSEKEQVGEGNADEPTVYRQLANGLERTAEKGDANLESVSRDNMIASEMLDHLAAGHETSGIALTFTMYHLSRNTAIQDALRKELLTLQPPLLFPPANAPPSSSLPIEDTVLPTSQSVDALPLLQAILLETLRLNAPIPGPEPRVTPSTTGGVQLGEYKALPGGVRVSTPAYTLHRNEEVFPEPETWRPERWLEADEAQRREMGRWWWAFSSGGRMCIGSNFAMQEMKVVLAAIYTNFQTELVSDEILEQSDGYTAGPKAEKLLLRFTRARDS